MVKSLSTDINLEEHAFFIVFISLILILFWHAVWGLLDEFTEVLNKKYGIKKITISVVFLLIVLLFIGIYPKILQNI